MGLGICISNRFPDVAADDSRTTLGKSLLHEAEHKMPQLLEQNKQGEFIFILLWFRLLDIETTSCY
jgi:hypothetical protein